MPATTTLLGLVTPTQGTLSGTWGDTVNYGISDYVDIAVAGTLTLTGDGAVTLANTTGSSSGSSITSTLAGAGTVTAQFAIVRVTGTLTTAKIVTAPSYSKTYTVVNAATGGIVTFKASGQTGVSVAVGESAFVYFNGTDYVKVSGTASVTSFSAGTTGLTPNTSTTGAVTLAGTLAIANGGTGQTTANTALNALLPSQTGNANKYLQTDGTNSSWDAVSLSTADITGTLGTANGGTGLTSFTSGGVVYASSTSALATGSVLSFDGTNLGIGTNSPSAKLDITSASAGFSNIKLVQTGVRTWAIENTGTSGLFKIIEAGVSDRLVIDSSGNLGIGTSSPVFIASGAETGVSIKSVSSNAAGINVSSSNAQNTRIEMFSAFGINQTGFYAKGDSAFPSMVFGQVSGSTFRDSMLLDSSGNLGLGVTPSASTAPTMDFGAWVGVGAVAASSSAVVTSNAYYDGTWRYKLGFGVPASKYETGGSHAWSIAASGTAGNPISFTQAMTLDASGNLLIGCTTGGSIKLRIQDDNGQQIRLQTATNTNRNLTLGFSNANDFGQINCDESGVNQKDLWYTALNHKFGRNTSSATMTLDASGNLLISKTTTAQTTRGVFFEGGGVGTFNSAQPDGGSSAAFYATSTGGNIGGISHNTAATSYRTSNTSGVVGIDANTFTFQTNSVERARFNSTGALVFAGGTTTANGIGITFPATQSASSDANTLDDYEEGTWTPVANNLTVVGTVSYVATYTKIGRVVYINLRVNATTSSTSTANSTFFDGLPFEPAINSTVTGVNEGNIASLGVGLFANGARLFAPSWTAVQNATLSGFYYV